MIDGDDQADTARPLHVCHQLLHGIATVAGEALVGERASAMSRLVR